MPIWSVKKSKYLKCLWIWQLSSKIENSECLNFIQQEMAHKGNLIKPLVVVNLPNKLSKPECGGVKEDVLTYTGIDHQSKC